MGKKLFKENVKDVIINNYKAELNYTQINTQLDTLLLPTNNNVNTLIQD